MRLDKGILTTLLVLLSLPLVAAGQEVSIGGKSEFLPYTFAEFEAVAPEKWGCTWEFPEKIQIRELDPKNRKVLAVGPPGSYTAVLFVAGLTGEKNDEVFFKRATKKFTIGKADPDDDKPDDEPDDDKNPAPIPDAGFRVLIVYESDDVTKYPPETDAILSGEAVRGFLEKNCVDENGVSGSRILDQHTEMKNAPPIWQKAMARPRKELPWVVISNGKTGYEGPLPKTQSAFVDLCTKYLPK